MTCYKKKITHFNDLLQIKITLNTEKKITHFNDLLQIKITLNTEKKK